MSSPPVEERSVPACVCSCFYATLRTGHEPERDGGQAFTFWRAMFERSSERPYEEPEHTKMRESLDALGEAGFRSGWEHLLRVYDATPPGALYECLHEQFAKLVQEGFERRARRTSKA